jgi:large subunit ribosomal protein L3
VSEVVGRLFQAVAGLAAVTNAERTTVQSLTVHAVDSDKNLLLIKGAVPGPRGGLVVVRSAAREGN